MVFSRVPGFVNQKSEIDRPTRVASDQTILCVVPRSCIMKYRAETMLPMIRTRASTMRSRMNYLAARVVEKLAGQTVCVRCVSFSP
jgi:hypothetical protein